MSRKPYSVQRKSVRRIHFVGIGGIGVSALAQWYLAQGALVTGSNLSEEPILALLRRKGAVIFVGSHRARHVPKNADLIVYTQAAPAHNPERREARRRGIPEKSYPEAVGELTREKFTIAVCGAHGKSTTTALAALMLVRTRLDPTVLVGTTLKEFGRTNFRLGRSKYLVLEADEWNGSFWHYHPDIVMWTTLDREHLDFYKNYAGVRAGFKKFLKNIKSGGLIIANRDDRSIRRIVSKSGARHIFYTLRDSGASRIRAVLPVPGEHNVANARAVLALADALHIPRGTALRTFRRFRGTWRRFEYKGALNGAPVYDDYGHHPTEIRATLAAARAKFPGRRIWCVYQPHQYQRTTLLFKEFGPAFKDADVVLLLDIYDVAGREKPRRGMPRIHSRALVKMIREQGTPAIYTPDVKGAASLLRVASAPNDLVIVMGAGSIWKIFDRLPLTRVLDKMP